MSARSNPTTDAPAGAGSVALPVVNPASNGSKMGRRRAAVLVAVHVLIALHALHYYVAGATVSPLEPSEGTYSLQTGVINTGLVFFCLLILSTMIFGRFFCGWACHVVAYQDLARWFMLRLGIRPQPVRMRAAFLLPLFAAFWLYGKPLLAYAWTPAPDAIAWHLTTEDFWRTFPGPIITTLTFLVCGFLIVYVMGSKGFCTYGCPYGLIFGIADRTARGRIRVKDSCTHTGNCTRTCSSNVNVADEVRRFGMVVDPGCMKCLDCVNNCPNYALYYGFSNSDSATKTREKRKPETGKTPDRPWSFTLRQEALIAGLWFACFAAYFKLYVTVPLLLAIGLSVPASLLLYKGGELLFRSDVSLQQQALKQHGRRTAAGHAVLFLGAITLLLTLHSGFIRWHTYHGTSAFERAAAILDNPADNNQTNEAIPTVQSRQADGRDVDSAMQLARNARASLRLVRRWGLFHTQGLGRMVGRTHQWEDDHAAAIPWLRLDMKHDTVNPATPFHLGESLHAEGRREEANRAYLQVLDRRTVTEDMFLRVGIELLRNGESSLATEVFDRGHQRYPANAELAMELCKALARHASTIDNALQRATRAAEQTVSRMTQAGQADADLLAMLAYLYSESGRWDEAIAMAEKSHDAAVAAGENRIASEMERMIAYYREGRERQRNRRINRP